MKIISVNRGLPREIVHDGSIIRTAIFKRPVRVRVRVSALNIEGDRQADLSVHGRSEQGVYAHPAEHYEFWRRELPGAELPWGSFGENLTVQGVLEKDIHIRRSPVRRNRRAHCIEPRLPCYKLNARFARPDMVKKFLHSRRTGFSLSVAREGEIGADDPIGILARDEQRVTVAEITRLYGLRPQQRRGDAARRRDRGTAGKLANLLQRARCARGRVGLS